MSEAKYYFPLENISEQLEILSDIHMNHDQSIAT